MTRTIKEKNKLCCFKRFHPLFHGCPHHLGFRAVVVLHFPIVDIDVHAGKAKVHLHVAYQRIKFRDPIGFHKGLGAQIVAVGSALMLKKNVVAAFGDHGHGLAHQGAVFGRFQAGLGVATIFFLGHDKHATRDVYFFIFF